MCGARWLLGRGCLELHRRTLRWSPARPRIWPPHCSIFRPRWAGGAPGWRRNARARIIAPRRAAQARKAPNPEASPTDCAVSALLVLLLALARLFLVAVGHQVVPQVWPPPPGSWRHGRAAVSGGAGTPFSLALQTGIALLVGACPCAWAWPAHAFTVGAGLAASLRPAVPRWRSIENLPPADRSVRQNRHPHPGPASDRRGAGADWNPVCEPERRPE